MTLETLTVPLKELEGFCIEQTRKFDFEEGTPLPKIAKLESEDGKKSIIGELISQEYMGGRIVASYKAHSIY